MSSILEALKKVEKESPRLDFTPEVTKGMDARKAVSRRARGARVIYRLIGSAFVIVVLGLGAWFVLGYEDLFRKSTIDRGPAPVVTKENPVTASLNIPAEKPAVEKASGPKETASGEMPRVETSSPKEEAPRETPSPAPEKIEIKSGGQETQAQQKAQKKEEVVSIKPPKEEIRESHPDSGKFKLEAIVWAETPQSRFAVINGQIVRAGGSMDGISITAIAKDHVAVRSGGREWKLMFIAE